MILVVIMLVAMPLRAFAYDVWPSSLRVSSYYIAYKNEVRMDFYWTDPAIEYVRLVFDSPSGERFEGTFGPDFSGILYMTCGGTYNAYLLSEPGGTPLGSVQNIDTSSQIINGKCESYPEGGAKDDLGLSSSGSSITWNPTAGAANYEVYKDGQMVGNVPADTSPLSYDVSSSGPGGYTVRAVDSSGATLAESDLIVSDPGTTDPGGGGTTPDDITLAECADLICQCIRELKPILNDIKSGIGDAVTELQEVETAVRDVETAVDEVKAQLLPTKEYPMPQEPDYPPVNLEDYKPPMHETGKFEDTNTYFTDQGDAPTPGKLPPVPEPVTEWETGSGKVSKQPNQLKEPSMTRDAVKQRDPVLQRDPELTREIKSYELRWKSEQYQAGTP
ncbi:hypothetical protein MF069_36525 [Paenibacillus mucilaginosus]|uniref:hypothetical protein n=1 Tax=Paenibacillus mucilaginosus TaxID=61624 RepID=UPI001EEF94A2|nr:hypothetical protein [Paenibacillus mucilaginosus]MCG7218207.1 hypothetical protein [Paenibacillus mucilaginosus]